MSYCFIEQREIFQIFEVQQTISLEGLNKEQENINQDQDNHSNSDNNEETPAYEEVVNKHRKYKPHDAVFTAHRIWK